MLSTVDDAVKIKCFHMLLSEKSDGGFNKLEMLSLRKEIESTTPLRVSAISWQFLQVYNHKDYSRASPHHTSVVSRKLNLPNGNAHESRINFPELSKALIRANKAGACKTGISARRSLAAGDQSIPVALRPRNFTVHGCREHHLGQSNRKPKLTTPQRFIGHQLKALESYTSSSGLWITQEVTWAIDPTLLLCTRGSWGFISDPSDQLCDCLGLVVKTFSGLTSLFPGGSNRNLFEEELLWPFTEGRAALDPVGQYCGGRGGDSVLLSRGSLPPPSSGMTGKDIRDSHQDCSLAAATRPTVTPCRVTKGGERETSDFRMCEFMFMLPLRGWPGRGWAAVEFCTLGSCLFNISIPLLAHQRKLCWYQKGKMRKSDPSFDTHVKNPSVYSHPQRSEGFPRKSLFTRRVDGALFQYLPWNRYQNDP
ncbi:hypothetical protein RRG08_043280 [Elysia crispata]|uniref:Uncharacterized protein n=1 Tax=Elysia crispata TaxID=231223 RepID=A0AAE0XYB4_9GAST|nr:hypothetical protein RRG08_043280 [Elysia crispata]